MGSKKIKKEGKILHLSSVQKTWFPALISVLIYWFTFSDRCVSRTPAKDGAFLADTPLSQTKVMENLTISCLNCNSLNMSDVSKLNQNRKLLAVTKLKSDIILLSDIRLSNKNKISCSSDLEKCFRTNPFGNYEFYHNSTMNKRGVGILLCNMLSGTVLNRKDDPDENYLLLELKALNKVFVIDAVYGPNNTDQNFFTRLKNDISNLGNRKVVLGGDWNATLSCEEVEFNIDVLNMRNVPNQRHSELIRDICNELDLIDPFRYRYPNT
jgi:exonuclease III